jgi:hypothetical protein
MDLDRHQLVFPPIPPIDIARWVVVQTVQTQSYAPIPDAKIVHDCAVFFCLVRVRVRVRVRVTVWVRVRDRVRVRVRFRVRVRVRVRGSGLVAHPQPLAPAFEARRAVV